MFFYDMRYGSVLVIKTCSEPHHVVGLYLIVIPGENGNQMFIKGTFNMGYRISLVCKAPYHSWALTKIVSWIRTVPTKSVELTTRNVMFPSWMVAAGKVEIRITAGRFGVIPTGDLGTVMGQHQI